MRHLKTYNESINSISIKPGIGKSQIMKDVAKKFGYDVIELKPSITIYELDCRDEKNRKCTGDKIEINENEFNMLKDKNLIFKGLFDDYYFFKDNKDNVNDTLNIIRHANKYNI